MPLQEDIAQSREYEMQTYIDSMQAMYNNALLQNGEVYDIAYEETYGFTAVTGEAILADSRIIKILRYAIAPSISQMKFGQFFGLQSVGKFEEDKLTRGASKFRELESIAGRMAAFVSEKIDRSRFIWLAGKDPASELAIEYAKKWTCSIAADQNAQTEYRNWRRAQQEHSIVTRLIANGYTRSGYRGVISRDTDINIGEYTQEIKVRGRTVQKADLAFRSRTSRKLVLIEAKAVGVELDATKRIKECCDKANDWTASENLHAPDVVAVIAGFFTPTNIANLQASGVSVVWEHRLTDLDGLA